MASEFILILDLSKSVHHASFVFRRDNGSPKHFTFLLLLQQIQPREGGPHWPVASDRWRSTSEFDVSQQPKQLLPDGKGCGKSLTLLSIGLENIPSLILLFQQFLEIDYPRVGVMVSLEHHPRLRSRTCVYTLPRGFVYFAALGKRCGKLGCPS